MMANVFPTAIEDGLNEPPGASFTNGDELNLQYDVMWCDVMWCGVTWHDVAWHDMISYESGEMT